jgi:hypothetical protein
VQLDPFTQQILDAFLGVLRRPRYNIEVGAVLSEHDYDHRIQLRANGENLILSVWQARNAVKIDCHVGSNDRANFAWGFGVQASPFHFSATFRRATPQNVRKMALLLAKKISLKPCFDIMKA